jgi:hypothetical protein
MNSYDPNSVDAMLSRILQRLDEQDKVLVRIEEQTTKTNGRVSALEKDKWIQRGAVGVVVVMVSAAWEVIKAKF